MDNTALQSKSLQLDGIQTNGIQTAQQRSFVYPAIWALYLIGFIVIAHCFDPSSTGLTLPSIPGTHLAAVFGFITPISSPCSGTCQTQPPPNNWTSLHLASPTDACSNISINPDLQSGCGFTLSTSPTPAPAPLAELSASATEELPPPSDDLLATSSSHTTTHTGEDPPAVQ